MSNQTTPLKNYGAAGALRGKASLVLCLLLSAGLSQALAAAESNNAPPNLSAAQIIDKHIAARGGLVSLACGADPVGYGPAGGGQR